MWRRLDVAASLVGRPDVLFLDEPTTGLDPRSRVDVWAFIRELQQEGTTILLTTQYLDEADQLADRITVVDFGEVIAEGTSDELKDRIGGEVLEIDVEDASETKQAADALQGLGTGEANVDVDEGPHSPSRGHAGSRRPAGRHATARRVADYVQFLMPGIFVQNAIWRYDDRHWIGRGYETRDHRSIPLTSHGQVGRPDRTNHL